MYFCLVNLSLLLSSPAWFPHSNIIPLQYDHLEINLAEFSTKIHTRDNDFSIQLEQLPHFDIKVD